jgi:hypothetical protein
MTALDVGTVSFSRGTPLGDYMHAAASSWPGGLPCCPHGSISDDARVVGGPGWMALSGSGLLFLDIDDPELLLRCGDCTMASLMDRADDDVCRLCGQRSVMFIEFLAHFQANIMVTGNACDSCHDRMQAPG